VTLREYTPRAFAPLVEDHFMAKPRCALWAKPGMGKTILTLNYLDFLYRAWGERKPTLVLAPLRVARDTWAKEAAKWRHLHGLEVAPIVGDPAQRKAALARDVPVYATNYEQLPWLIDTLGDRWPFGTVIADEAVKLKGFRIKQGTARSQALGRFTHTKVERFIELTGTPASNGLKDLWGQMWFLDGGQRLGRSYSAFEERWFAYKRVKDAISGKVEIKPIILPTAHEEIHARVADLCLTLDPKDWFDLREPVVNVIEVEMPPSARRHYRELEKELFTVLAGGEEIDAVSAAALSMKCRQAAGGALYLDQTKHEKGAWAEIHREKVDALQELIDETGTDPLLVVYEFQHERERVLREWPETLDLSRQDHLERAKAGQGKLWLGHPASVGEGVDGLQDHCNTVVFFGQTWRLDLHDQIIERVGPMRQLQAGKDRNVFVHYIAARQTVDQVVLARRDGKRSVQDALMDYMKGNQ
jgi:SNF2 family DNA or RNA helicase